MQTLSEESKKNLLAIFSKNMTTYRKAMKVSQEEFGNLIGITRQTVSSIERGAYALTWSIFLSSLFVLQGSSAARAMIINSFAGDEELANYLSELLGTPVERGYYEFSSTAKQMEFASCVIVDEPGYPLIEYDEAIKEIVHGEEKPSFLAMVCEEDRETVQTILDEKIRKQMFVCAEFRLVTEDGGYMSVNCVIRRQKKLMKDGRFDVVLTQITGEPLKKHAISGMMDQIPVGVVVYELSPNGDDNLAEVFYANDNFYEVIGHSKEQFAAIHNNSFTNLVASDDTRRISKIFSSSREKGTLTADLRINTFEGNAQWIHLSSKILSKSDDGSSMLVLVLTNITNRVNSELNMKYQLDRYRQIDEVTDDVQFNYELSEDRFTIPVKFGKFQNPATVIKHFIAENKSKGYVHPEDYEIYRKQSSEALAVGGKSTAEYRIKIDGKNYNWCRIILNCVVDDQGVISYVYGRILIIDEEKRILKEYKDDKVLINRLSSTDRLTGLFNRTAFRGRVQEILKKDDMKKIHAIIYMDINNFSFINEKYGYPAGDRLLRDFSQMFLRKGRACFGCRPHSDYFLVYLNEDDKRVVLSKINNWAKLFAEHQSKTYPGIDIRISAGVYFLTNDEEDITQAIDNANIARKHIKNNKLKNICIFTQSLKERRNYEQTIIGEISDAIKDGKIEVFLQPKFSLETRSVIGAEALARWRSDDGSYRNASDFIPILEESGKITDLDFCVYTRVLQALRQWRRYGKRLVPVSVNFSDRHNTYQGFDEKVYRLAEQYNVDNSYIMIEVKENILTSNVDNICDKVASLQEKGFGIALDGFGYGTSSLGFLLAAPVDVVKVDKAIWKNVTISGEGKEFVTALATLIMAAKKEVLFEGVETEEQASMLAESGFVKAQGFLFAEPMSIEDFEKNYLV